MVSHTHTPALIYIAKAKMKKEKSLICHHYSFHFYPAVFNFFPLLFFINAFQLVQNAYIHLHYKNLVIKLDENHGKSTLDKDMSLK